MNKTISINIGKTNFFIEEAAYAKLDTYLVSIREHFALQEGSEEIVADIENRIAEKFSAGLNGNRNGVITEPDVDAVIAQLGTPQDISSQDTPAENASAQQEHAHRFMRDTDNGIIGGVCAGIAAYFDADPLIVRLIFIALLIAWGFALPLYIILWIITPEAKTPAEKMEMRGKPFTLSALSKTLQDRAREMKRSSGKFRAFINTLFRTLGGIVRILFIVLAKIIGICVAFASGITMIALTFLAAIALFNTGSEYLKFPLETLAAHPGYHALVLMSYLILVIPFIFLLFAGMALVSRRRFMGAAAALTLLGVWMLSGIAGGVLAIQHVPSYVQALQNSPELMKITETRKLEPFTALDLEGNFRYTLTTGTTTQAIITGTQRGLEETAISVREGTLEVRSSPGQASCALFCPDRTPHIEIITPSLQTIKMRGGMIMTQKALEGDTLELNLENARANMEITADALSLGLFGSRATLSGSVNTVEAILSGYARVDAPNLEVRNALMRLQDYSRAQIYPLESLTYALDKHSRIDYGATPLVQAATSTPSDSEEE